MATRRDVLVRGALAAGLAATARRGVAREMPGITPTTIKLGQTIPYSGPASAYGTIGRSQVAYFETLNRQGGINGRAVTLLSLDDAYSPAKTVEQTRRLVEQEGVAAIFAPLGTPTSVATRKYLNDRRVPQLFISSGASFWGDYRAWPFSMGWAPTYAAESGQFAAWLLRNKPQARLAMMAQSDDSGRDYMDGLVRGLGDRADRIVVYRATYEVTDPTIDSPLVGAKQAGADTLFLHANPKFAALGVRKVFELDWHPTFFLSSTGASIATALRPAGLEKAQDILTGFYLKDPNDEEWANDAGMRAYLSWMKAAYPEGNPADVGNIFGYSSAETMAQVLRQCGDDLTRDNIMRQAENLNMDLALLLPGSRITTSPTDHHPIKYLRMARFQGERWKLMPD